MSNILLKLAPRGPKLIARALADDITAAAALTTGEKFICPELLTSFLGKRKWIAKNARNVPLR